MQTHVTAPLETHVVYLGKKEIYCNFRTHCIASLNFWPYFPHLFSYFDKIRYNKSTKSTAQYRRVS